MNSIEERIEKLEDRLFEIDRKLRKIEEQKILDRLFGEVDPYTTFVVVLLISVVLALSACGGSSRTDQGEVRCTSQTNLVYPYEEVTTCKKL